MWGIFLFFATIGLLLYYPVSDYMLIDDGVSGLWEVKDMSWEEIFRSSEFKSLYQLHYVFLYGYYHVFGASSVAYYVWFVLLQSAVLTAFYYAMSKLANLFGLSKTNFVFFVIGILLMTSPHNFENIAWAATSHYNLAFLFFFVMLSCLLDALLGKKQKLILFYSLFSLSLFTMEMSVLFPLSFGLIVFAYWMYSGNRVGLKKGLLLYVIPSALLVLLSFALLKVLNNSWFPRSGTVAIFIPSVLDSITNFWSYWFQGIGYTHYLSFRQRESFYRFVDIYVFWPGLLSIGFIIFYCLKKKKYFPLVLFLMCGIFLLPNLYRWGTILNRYENVRFLYFTLPFMLSVVLLLFYKRKLLLAILSILFLTANLYFMYFTIQDKVVAGKIHEKYLEELQSVKSNDVYLLNIPSFAKGNFIFRGSNRVRIADAMKDTQHNEIIFKEVLWYYAQSAEDSFSVEKTDSLTLRVSPKTDGVWPMNESIGASSYENENVKVTLGEWGSYEVRFKKAIGEETRILLFSDGSMIDCKELL